MGSRFTDMQTPEQQDMARQAPRLREMAYATEQQAEKHQMTADVYGRSGTDYSDQAPAARAQREADRLRRQAGGLRETATYGR